MGTPPDSRCPIPVAAIRRALATAVLALGCSGNRVPIHRPTPPTPRPIPEIAAAPPAAATPVPFAFDGVLAGSPEAIALDLLTKLRDGDVLGASSRFDEMMWSSLVDEGLLNLWPEVVEQSGEFRGVTAIRRERAGFYEVVHVLCSFEGGDLDVRVPVTAGDKIHGLWFAQPEPPPFASASYVDPARFAERDVLVGDARLPGRLALPVGDAPAPALVLVHGSGPLDRDATTGALKPFRDLAEGLASRGVVVLRYDKRTKHLARTMSAAAIDRLDLEQESMADARAALRLVRREPRVDLRRVFLLGHSLGGVAAVRVAANDPMLAGVVLMAAPARPLEDVILDQVRYLAALRGPIGARHRRWLEDFAAQVDRVKTLDAFPLTPAEDLPLGIAASFWRDLAAHPAPVLAARERRPFLVLQGERDYQVTVADAEIWARTTAANSAARVVRYPGLNHAFVEGTRPASPADYRVPGHVAVRVIDDIAAFVTRR